MRSKADFNLQNISGSIKAVWRQTLQDVNAIPGTIPCPKQFRKELYV